MEATTEGFNEAAGIPRGRRALEAVKLGAALASMRPRVFPAEDPDALGRRVLAEVASMRPRVFPAEDLVSTDGYGQEFAASMRPRVFPAEDASPRETRTARQSGFNEAAGIPRGRRLIPGHRRRPPWELQ